MEHSNDWVRSEINATLIFFNVPKYVREKTLAHLDAQTEELQQLNSFKELTPEIQKCIHITCDNKIYIAIDEILGKQP